MFMLLSVSIFLNLVTFGFFLCELSEVCTYGFFIPISFIICVYLYLVMFDIIRILRQSMTSLENDNEILKERVKTLENLKNVVKSNDNGDESYKRICAVHVRSFRTYNDKFQIIFRDDELRYAAIRVQISPGKTKLSIFARLDDNKYQKLTQIDINHLYKIFKSFGLSIDNDKLDVNPTIYDRCIAQTSSYLSKCDIGFTEENEEIVQEMGKEKENIKNDDDFFEKNEKIGNDMYFVGTGLKRGVMNEYKSIYQSYGESALLEQTTSRFLNLWEKSKDIVLKYFNM